MSTFDEQCELERREIYASRDRERRRVAGMRLDQVLAEVRASRVGRTGVSAHVAPVRRARIDTEELRAQLAYGRSFEPIPVPEASEPAAVRRVVRYWVGNSRFGALREVVVAEPAQRDRWGRPTKQGLFR